MRTEYSEFQDNKNQSKSNQSWSPLDVVRGILEVGLYKSLVLIALIGYVIIAFSGHISDWSSWWRYFDFIIFISIFSLIFYFFE